ncbi:hypothetical protein [Microbacterium sp. CIAB417]|uniref:hypothetical protein n=1 Tax=Microbacterium sp. CIAB417 TaxID=2860287 RepID=UPI001FABD61F|nr:hypothetical protein [Microbacterium sp. CIAB417]
MSDGTDAAGPRDRMLRVWPAVVGVVFAAGMIALLSVGIADTTTATEILTAAAFVYLGSAALGHRTAAWPLFGLTFLLIGAGLVVRGFSPMWAMVVLVGALFAFGLVRGRVRPRWGIPLQAAAMLAVLLLALIIPALPSPWGAVLVGIGLVLHAGWDVHHLRTRRVVASSMAEFCAALDVVLAAGVILVAAA